MTDSTEAREHRVQVTRSARYYALGGTAAPAEAWVVLHGFSQLAGEFIRWFAPAAGPSRLILAPEALNRYYTDHRTRKVGATWMTSEDRLAEIEDYVGYLDAVVEDARAQYGFDAVEVHGFSQGCATASRWVALGRVRPTRLVLWGGTVPPDLDLARHGPRLSAASLAIVIGDRDKFLPEDKVAAELGRLTAAGVSYEARRFRGGHVIPWPVLAELAGMPAGETA